MNKRTSHLAVALAVIGVGLLVLSGCGRARRDAATVAPSSVPVTAVSASTASTVAGASPSTSTGPAAVDPEQLAEITAELGTVDSQIAGVSGDVDVATNAINSQEGDPSK